MKHLENNSDLALALKASRPYGLLGKTVVAFRADLSDKVASTSLTRLEKLGMIEEQQTARIERRGRPEKVYRVTQEGVDWLRENGFWNAAMLGTSDPIELAHRYCQELVGACAPMGADVMIEFNHPLAMGRNIRFDVVMPLDSDEIQLIEIEQSLERNNIARAVEKFERLGEFFSNESIHDYYRSDVLFVFNLNAAALPKTLSVWGDALARAFPGDVPLPFTPRYAMLDAYVFNPSLSDMTRYPIIEKGRTGKTAGLVAQGIGIPDYRNAPSTQEMLGSLQSILEEGETSVKLPAQDADQLFGLCEIAMTIYCRSMYVNSPALKYSAFPHESVMALRDFLHMPENHALFQNLKDGMAWLEGRKSGLMVYRDAATRLVRDVFLRHFGFGNGLEIGSALHVYVNVPDPGERFSEIKIEAHLSKEFEHLRKPGMVARTEEYEKALSWMLTALFSYPVDLGFSEDLWSFPKRTGGKRGSAQ